MALQVMAQFDANLLDESSSEIGEAVHACRVVLGCQLIERRGRLRFASCGIV